MEQLRARKLSRRSVLAGLGATALLPILAACEPQIVEVEKQVKKSVDSGRYEVGLRQIAGLRPRVDYFFDKVLVMSPDPAIRQNRLRLLSGLDRLFSTIARFSEVIVAPD